MKTSILSIALCLCASLAACDDRGDAPSSEERDGLVEPAEEAVALAVASPASAAKLHRADAHAGSKPGPVMPEAKQAFEELSALIEAEYVDGPLSEDELWTGAMEGVLARLVQLEGHQINALMSPREFEKLIVGTKGRLVGVGIMIERVADVVVIRGVLPDGPAERSGLEAGDRILGIDGERIKDLDLGVVVDKIRGADGSSVDLFVQRDTEEWTETVVRGQVKVPSVQSTRLTDALGYLRITSFSKTTTEEVDEQLQALAQQGADRLVLDLRACPGGLLEPSLDLIARFVPSGKPVLTLTKKDGESTVRSTEGEYPWQSRPLVVLIGPKTASGAEIVADAIHEHGRGRLLGEATLGKHTVESLHELSEGWAVKLSVSRFATASGQDVQGQGVVPDIQIAASSEFDLAPVDELQPDGDPVLSAAIALLDDR